MIRCIGSISGKATLRILEILEIKTVPYVPLTHPFVELLIGTLRRECLDRMLFWTTADMEAKLADFQHYYNEPRSRPEYPSGGNPLWRNPFAHVIGRPLCLAR